MNRKSILFGFCLGAFAVSAAAQTTVTTSGTTSSGTVPVFNGTATVTNSPISVSGSNVGIGTTSPSYGVDVSGYSSALRLTYRPSAAVGPLVSFEGGNNTSVSSTSIISRVEFKGTASTAQGRIAYGLDSASPSSDFLDFMIGNKEIARFLGSGNVGIGTTSPGAALEVDGNVKLTANSGASITFQDGTTQSTAYTGVICGGDYAESVDVTGDRTEYEPGDVLVIDPDAPGKFLKSAEPYSTSVTGIYSTKPGVVGRRQTTPKSPDEVPMAMIGIVPTKVSAENGPIRPGDLLVTSSTLGFAMKGTDRSRMMGAVIGKALGSLDSSVGVIDVVVTLQ